MAKSISATEAVRRFSDLLGAIKFRGARYTIVRGGKPIATIGPVESEVPGRTLGELKRLLREIPKLGKEADAFELDLQRTYLDQPHLPSGYPWE
jgi:antitoxin (DNA-binding transcriptional repressor) of toxin-antitoxin stability system